VPSGGGLENGLAPVVVLYHRDLRVHDHPALAEAARTGRPVLPLFVVDKRLFSGPRSANRAAFLVESLTDLRGSLERMAGQLYIRVGDPLDEVMKVVAQTGAETVHVGEDVTPLARRRQDLLEEACRNERVQLSVFPGPMVVPAGDIVPTGADHYRVFTPYWRRWKALARRAVEATPRKLAATPGGFPAGPIPSIRSLSDRSRSPDRACGGETIGRRAAGRWLGRHLGSYPAGRDDLAGERTSRLSPYLHFGCLSANELVTMATDRPGGEEFIRQLCWRDFHHQVLAAFPALGERDYRPRPGRTWRQDDDLVRAWKEGRTGVPIVDAGMRQLLAEGWMHNRARLLVASYLTRDRGVHWRVGADHFMDWLVDADVANNYGNWQWVAGTGNDTRPNRRFNLLLQARRFDPEGDYVRRYVPELADLPGPAIHQPERSSSALSKSGRKTRA
jgi:deoxyribodipyrimidine photo-lyase